MEKLKTHFSKTERILLPVLACHSFEQFVKNINLLYKYVSPTSLSGIFIIPINSDISILGQVLMYCKSRFPDLWIGVNLLTYNPETICTFLKKYNPNGFWTDKSFVTDTDYQNVPEIFLNLFESIGWNGLYFGGTLFKYTQSVGDSSKIVINTIDYCDVIITSGYQTGSSINPEKLKMIRNAISEKNPIPIATASGNDNHIISRDKGCVNIFLFRTCCVDENDDYIPEKIEIIINS
jgi:hypothetical protein